MNIITLQNASFQRNNKTVLQHINWQLNHRQAWAITGPTASGKTSFLLALAGKLRISKGNVQYHFEQQFESRFDTLRHNVELVSFQENPALNYSKHYYQQRYHATETDGLITVKSFLFPDNNITEEGLKEIAFLGLNELLDMECIKLSNGQTKKILLAKALLRHPTLLLLDDPYMGLDINAREQLNIHLNRLIQQDKQVIMICRKENIPEQITNVLALNNGKVKATYIREKYLALPERELPEINSLPDFSFLKQHHNDFNIAIGMKDVNIAYGRKSILSHINWTVKKGEKWSLLGGNGSGKTMLLSLIYGDNPQAFANNILLFDQPKGSGESIWDIKKRIGFLSPEQHLYFNTHKSCRELIIEGLQDEHFKKINLNPQQENLLDELLAYYEIQPLTEKSFLQISTGEQRLILLIRSLFRDAPLLILDEPFQALDENLINRSRKLIDHYCSDATTMLFVTHYWEEIPSVVDEVFEL